MTVVSVAVEATKFLFGMCDCTDDSDVGTDDFSLVPGILHVCGHAHVRSHVPPDMDCKFGRWNSLTFPGQISFFPDMLHCKCIQ